jgi:hypothetical protein
VHDQLPPSLEKYYFASVRGLASIRSKRPCLAARTLLLADFAIGLPPQCRDLCQISCTRFSPVRYHQISSAIAGAALYSRFGGHSGGATVKGEGRARGMRFPPTSLGTTQSLTRGMYSEWARMTSANPSSSACCHLVPLRYLPALLLVPPPPLSRPSSSWEFFAAGYAQPQERPITSTEATLLARAQIS